VNIQCLSLEKNPIMVGGLLHVDKSRAKQASESFCENGPFSHGWRRIALGCTRGWVSKY
jgi:hypothetical protein